MKARARRARGFTLIEMMAVVVVVLGVTGVAIAGYVDISSQNLRAAGLTRDARRATAILDRVARDLESARLTIKPEERDPLEHPWVFLAETRRSSEGADRLKFITLGQPPVASRAAASDLSQVAWLTRQTAEGDTELLRWSFPRLSEGLDRNFPRADDPGVFLVADGLEQFGVRFLDDAGEWTSRWDSSTLAQSSQLPLLAEISVAMAARDPGEPPSETFVRRVILPLRPIDLEARLKGTDAEGKEGEEDEEAEDDCLRVRDCVDLSLLTPDLLNVISDLNEQCLSDTGIPNEVLLPECR